MMTLQIVFTLLFGLALGSFLNVCISRLPRHQSIIRPPSHCPRCNTPIAARNNIPFLSFFLLRGRCRTCQKPISWRYPLVEAVTAVLALACTLTFGIGLDGISSTIFCTLLLALAVCDAETMRLPDTLTLPLLGLGILHRAADGLIGDLPHGAAYAWHSALSLGLRGAISAVATAVGLLLLRGVYSLLRRRQGLGLGDVKLAAGIAAWLGLHQMGVVFFLAVVTGALSTVIVLAFRGKQTKMPDGPLAVPFGTFLCMAGIYCAFFGADTLAWYLQFFP